MHHFGRAATSCAAVWMRAFIKNYVLTLLFLKYVSDKHKYGAGMIELHAGTTFDDIVKLKNTADIGDRLNKIIAQIAEANDLKGVIDVTDFNDEDKLGKGKEMIDRLSRLVGIFKKLNLSSNQAEDDDLLGDAYEYLMRHFATESGKSKGQFYTPAEVSRIMAKIIGISADCRPAPAFMTRPAARVRCCSKPPPKPAAKSAFTVRKKMWQPRPLPV